MALKLICSIIPLVKVSIELMSLIIPALAYAIYLSQLADDIRGMLHKPKLKEVSIWNIYLVLSTS